MELIESDHFSKNSNISRSIDRMKTIKKRQMAVRDDGAIIVNHKPADPDATININKNFIYMSISLLL